MSDGKIVIETGVDTKGAERDTRSLAGKLSGSLGRIATMMASAFAVKQLITFGKACTEVASNLQEVQNVVDTAFGSMTYKMEEFADSAIDMYGISKLTAKQTGSTFMAMAKGLGMSAENASDMAISLTALSADMASFYNVSQDVASVALKSIFTGETETLKQYGIVMTQTNLQEYARQQGITKNIQKMTQAEQVQLRYNYVLSQTTLAQGDFAKTSSSWANQTRILSERWKEFMGIVGNGMVQILTPLINILNQVMSQVTNTANAISQWLGVEGTVSTASEGVADASASMASGLDDVEESATAAEEALKGLAKYDELNVIDKGESGAAGADNGGAFGGITKLNALPDKTEKEFGVKVNGLDKLQEFVKYLEDKFRPTLNNFAEKMKKPLSKWVSNFKQCFDDLGKLKEPLISYLKKNYIPMLQQTVDTAGTIMSGLLDSSAMVFGDMWSVVIYPFLENLLTALLPTLTNIKTGALAILETAFENVKAVFDSLWTGAIVPILSELMKIYTDLTTKLQEFWDKYGLPITSSIKQAINGIGDTLKLVIDTIIIPAIEIAMAKLDEVWTKHLSPLVTKIGDAVGKIILCLLQMYNNGLKPIIDTLIEVFGPVFLMIFEEVADNVGFWAGIIGDVLGGVLSGLSGIIEFLTGVFTLDWEMAWQGIVDIFESIWGMIIDIAKPVINLLIGLVNKALQSIEDSINLIVGGLNKLSFKVPNWVPELGGKTFGFDLKNVNFDQIPYLATGAVLPPNKPFMAMLGDQKNGTNIETPLSTMIEAFNTALNARGGGNQPIIVQIGDRQLAEIVWDEEDKMYKQTGKRR